MSGRKCKYYCSRCDYYFKAIKHHGGLNPKCPKCKERDKVSRITPC